jgi:hypothetical protein
MAGFYNFFRGIPGKLGVGVADEGYLRSSSEPNNSGIGIDRQVRGGLRVSQSTVFMTSKSVPTVSPLGLYGLDLHGVPILGPLANKG